MKALLILRYRPKDKRTKFAFSVFVFLCLYLSSCERRELTYYEESEISVTADWSKANLDDESGYGATLIFYPQDGGEPKVVRMNDRIQSTVRLTEGSYDIILFNRSFNDFGSVAFRGQEKLETLEAYAKKVETRAETRVIVSSPEKLATAVVRGFKVTESMLGNYAPATTRGGTGRAACPVEDCTLHLTPTPLTCEIQATLNVKGLNNVYEAQCTLNGMPLSIFLANGSPSEVTGKQEFTVENSVFNSGSQTEGTLTGTLNAFGLNTKGTQEMEFKALLVDKKTVVIQEVPDVTVKEEETGENILLLYIEASAPAPLPDVKPDGGGNSGFDTDIEDWGKEQEGEITG